MTYNFDPERWYDNQRALLDARRRAGELDEQEYRKASLELDKRYDKMLERLDGTYRIPRDR